MAELFILIVILGGAYLLFWPVPIDPKGWNPPLAPPYEGRFAHRNLMSSAEKLWLGKIVGPEATAIKDGYIYTGLGNGDVVRMHIESQGDPEVLGNTGGHPLGLKFDADGNLIICDANKGLLCLTPAGEISVLSDSVNGRKYKVPDDLGIAADGKIYFSDISSKWTLDDADFAIMEDNALGELICYDPATKTSSVVLDGMHLSNGVAMGPDDEYLLVNQTLGFCVTRLWLKGPKAGQSEPFVENLPGGPDNITFNGKDTYWVALAFPRFPRLETLAPKPFLKKLMLRLPKFLAPVPEFFDGLNVPGYGLFVGVDMEGNITHFADAHDGAFGMVTSVLEYEGQLYIGGIAAEYIGRMPVPDPV